MRTWSLKPPPTPIAKHQNFILLCLKYIEVKTVSTNMKIHETKGLFPSPQYTFLLKLRNEKMFLCKYIIWLGWMIVYHCFAIAAASS